MTKILIIDDSKDLGPQFQQIAKATGLSIADLEAAWQRDKSKNVICLNKPGKSLFELMHLVPEKEPMVEEKQSWQQQRRNLPKFLKKS